MNDTAPPKVEPTGLDRTIAHYFPGWGERRQAARYVMEYRQAERKRTSEAFDQTTGTLFGLSRDQWAVMNMRQRARHAVINNAVARTILKTETDNVIGDGVNFQPTSSDKDWNREAEDRYYEWVDTCDLRGIQNGAGVQRMAWSSSRQNGDGGWVHVARGAESFVQLVDAKTIRTPNEFRWDRNIVDGILYDTNGTPTLFYVLYEDQWGKQTYLPVSPRDFVYLAHLSEINQARPESCFATTFEPLNDLDRYVGGVALAAWMATVFGLIFKQNNGAKEMQGLGYLTNSQGVQQKAVTLENGMVKYIGNADDVVQVDAKQPIQQTPEWIRAQLRLIGMPFDMPLEVLARDMSTVNFASARIGLLPFYRACRIRFDHFRTRWSGTIQWWLKRESLRADSDPKKWLTKFPADFLKHELYINAWDYTDPISEAQSDLLQVDMGSKSMQMVIRERGRNADRILQDRLAWQDETSALPTVHSNYTRHPQLGVGPQGDPLGKEAVEPPGTPSPSDEPQQEPADEPQAQA